MSTETEVQKRARSQAEHYLDSCSEYSAPYEREKIVADWLSKESKAEDLVKDFERRAGILAKHRMLELGFGNGLHIPAFARAGALMHGLEVNQTLLEIGKENMRQRGIDADLRVYDGAHMPYPDAYFDYLFATSVLEHVSDLDAILREADRVLKSGGKFYISFPNRWAPRETHTGFWFVGYLPRPVARQLLHVLGSNAMEELNLHFLSYFTLRRLIRRTSLRVRFEYGHAPILRRAIKRILGALGLHHSVLLKTIMVILEKSA